MKKRLGNKIKDDVTMISLCIYLLNLNKHFMYKFSYNRSIWDIIEIKKLDREIKKALSGYELHPQVTGVFIHMKVRPDLELLFVDHAPRGDRIHNMARRWQPLYYSYFNPSINTLSYLSVD